VPASEKAGKNFGDGLILLDDEVLQLNKGYCTSGLSPTDFEPLIDSKQAASLLGVHWKTVQQLARSGQIPGHRIGSLWRFRASELDAWLRTGCAVNASALQSDSQSVRVN
jgi:excisionase family DNA binding protein